MDYRTFELLKLTHRRTHNKGQLSRKHYSFRLEKQPLSSFWSYKQYTNPLWICLRYNVIHQYDAKNLGPKHTCHNMLIRYKTVTNNRQIWHRFQRLSSTITPLKLIEFRSASWTCLRLPFFFLVFFGACRRSQQWFPSKTLSLLSVTGQHSEP